MGTWSTVDKRRERRLYAIGEEPRIAAAAVTTTVNATAVDAESRVRLTRISDTVTGGPLQLTGRAFTLPYRINVPQHTLPSPCDRFVHP